MTASKKIKGSDLPRFDAAEHLRDEADIAAYLTVVAREALYKALRPGAHPRFETIQRVCAALGMKLTAVPA